MSFVAVAIGGAGILGAGASLGSAFIGANAANNAANAQVGMEQQALALQEQQLGKLNPWINVGSGANYTLGQLMGIGSGGQQTNPNFSSFFNSPDYQFALTQGNNALQNYQNAMGLGKSGSGEAAALQFGQGLATQQYGNYFNRLMGLSQLGAQSAQAGVAGANGAAGTLGSIGQSMAGGITGTANAYMSGLSGVAGAGSGMANNLLLYNLLNKGNAGVSAYANSAGGSIGGSGITPLGMGGIGSA